MPADLLILYEHPDWFAPLFAALDRAGIGYEEATLEDHRFDPAAATPPAPVIFSRLAMSSFLRQASHPIFYAEALYAHWASRGARVINGAEVVAIDSSKARQLSLISGLGLKVPATRVVHRRQDVAAAAAEIGYPLLVKANIGGSGAGIVRFDSREELEAAVAADALPVSVDAVLLVQEYVAAASGSIVRVETLAGKYLYAIEVRGAGASFDLCPADACVATPGRPAIEMVAFSPPPEAIAAAERIAQAAGLDVGGVEYLVDPRDGSPCFYDINALSNFVADPNRILGWDPHDRLVEFLRAELERAR